VNVNTWLVEPVVRTEAAILRSQSVDPGLATLASLRSVGVAH
jgi:hypothetical protein